MLHMAVKKWDADKMGGVASFLCAVHCALSGLAVSVLPLIGLSFLHEPWVEVTFYGTAVLLGVWAAVRGWRLHKSVWPAVCFAFGLGLVAYAHWGMPHEEGSPLEAVGHGLSAIGGIVLVGFHILNARLTKSHACSCRSCADHRDHA